MLLLTRTPGLCRGRRSSHPCHWVSLAGRSILTSATADLLPRSDRFPAPVKSAILSTVTILLTRVPQFVKPFFPQLQRTFLKSLTDPTSLSVRNRGAGALKVLMEHQARVDPVITELSNLAQTEEGEIRDSVVNGLANVVFSGGKNMGDSSKSAALDLISEAFADTNKGKHDRAPRFRAELTVVSTSNRELQRRHRSTRCCTSTARRRLPPIHHRLVPAHLGPTADSTLLRHAAGDDRHGPLGAVRARCTEDGHSGVSQQCCRNGAGDCQARAGGEGADEGEEAVE